MSASLAWDTDTTCGIKPSPLLVLKDCPDNLRPSPVPTVRDKSI